MKQSTNKTWDARHIATNQQGFALVVVIVIMLLITFLAAQLILSVRTELHVAHNAKNKGTELALAEAGINLGLFRLLDRPIEYINEDYEMFLEGYQYLSFLKTGRFSYYVINESGKMDLNKLNETLLPLFLEYMGMNEEDKDIIMDSLRDWSDSDDLHRLNGAESETYEQLADPYIARNGNIREPAEFFLVNGTKDLSRRFKASEIFTVHNTQIKVNFNSLPPLMLDFLTEGDKEKQKAYREAQDLYGTLTNNHARSILGDERFEECRNGLTFSSGNVKFYSIIARGEAGTQENDLHENEPDSDNKKAHTEVRVLFELRGSNVNYYSWEEGVS